MKRSHIMLLSVLFVIVFVIGGFFLIKDRSNEQAKEKTAAEVPEKQQAETITQENGDTVYIPSKDEIAYDDDQKLYYYENLLNVYLSSEISDKQAEELAGKVNGTIAGRIQGTINMLQLQVEESSIDELEQLASRFDDNDLVEFARTSIPSSITELKELELKDTDWIESGWWTEAIHASEAWKYLDDHESEFKKVKVGVLEAGRLGEGDNEVHNHDIKESVSKISNAEGGDFYDGKGKIENRHPIWVTRFIASDANKEPEGFRGVAHGVADIRFTAMGSDINKERSSWGQVPEPYTFAFIKSNVEDGVKVINNSWGTPLDSKKAWDKSSDKKEKNYEEYIATHQNSIDEVSAQLIVALDKLLSDSENNDF